MQFGGVLYHYKVVCIFRLPLSSVFVYEGLICHDVHMRAAEKHLWPIEMCSDSLSLRILSIN